MKKMIFFWSIPVVVLLISVGCVNEKVIEVKTPQAPKPIAEKVIVEKNITLATPPVISIDLSDKAQLENNYITILKPDEKTFYKEKFISVVFKVDNSKIDTVKVYQGDNHFYTIDIKEDKTIYCKSINLINGNNKIAIFGYKNNQKVTLKTRDIYRVIAVMKRYSFAPKGYEKSFFHADKNEKLCKSCHKMDSNEDPNIKFSDPKESNCYTCHNSLTSRTYTHPASKNWQCTTCHNGQLDRRNRKYKGLTRYLVIGKVSTACLSCHKGENAPKWFDKELRHDPAKGGSCNKCHNPHGSENEFFIRRPAYNLCGNCHKEKLVKGHIINAFSGNKKHPVHGFDDPSRKGKELSCISCHNPHATNNEFFLRRPEISLCLLCHEKYK